MRENADCFEVIKYIQETIPKENLVKNPDCDDYRVIIEIKNVTERQIRYYNKKIRDRILGKYTAKDYEVKFIKSTDKQQ